MAWTEQCKLAFHANARAELLREKPGKDGRRPVTKILRRLAKDSGVPYKTLERWYYDMENEKPILKNEDGTTIEDNSGNNITEDTICRNCGKRKVYIDNKNGKPLSSKSKAYALCSACRVQKQKEEKETRKVVCPECGYRFLP